MINKDLINEQNRKLKGQVEEDYSELGNRLSRRGIDIDEIMQRTSRFSLAIPSWGVGTGGTRFGRFPNVGEPRNIFEKLDDCAVINQLSAVTPRVSLHIPWDKTDDILALKQAGKERNLGFDAINSNTFEDQPGQIHSYKFGSLSHTSKETRQQAIEHNIECIEIGEAIGSKALTVWIGDGSNFPGQQNFSRAFEHYLDSLRQIYVTLPEDWRIFIEHKLYEPAFYSTVMQDWGSNFLAVSHLGDKAYSLVDLGHHAPGTNIEMIVARLLQADKLGGFHFNDSKYGDDDLDSGSINPFLLFLIFNEILDVTVYQDKVLDLSYMIDQSHNVTDPIESIICSAIEIQRSYVQALLIDRNALVTYQEENDAISSLNELKKAFRTDVDPILSMNRLKNGAAIEPISVYRSVSYRKHMDKKRPQNLRTSGGIV